MRINEPSNQPIASGIAENNEASKAIVSSGLLGNDAKLQMMHSDESVANSPLKQRPSLLEPSAFGVQAQILAQQSATADLQGLGQMTQEASNDVASTMVRVQLGMQAPEDQERLQGNIATLDGAASYVDSLTKEEGGLSNSEKAIILGGQGFSDQQVDGLLLSQSDSKVFKEKIQALHGDSYDESAADLKELGFSESQINLILSLGDKDIINNDARKGELNNVFKDNPQAQKLVSLGFDEKSVRNLLSISNGGDGKGNIESGGQGKGSINELLKRSGFDEKDTKVILANGDPEKLKEQSNLLKTIKPGETSNILKLVSDNTKLLANSPLKPFLEESLKQQADIFMVLELIHKSSVQQRRYAREQRSLEYDAAKQEVLGQAENIRKAALYTLAADIVSGGASIVGGMQSVKAGAKGGLGRKKAPSSSNKPGNDVEVSKGRSKGKSKADSDGDEGEVGSSSKKKRKRSDDETDSTSSSSDIRSNRKLRSKKNQKKQSEKEAERTDKKRSESKEESHEAAEAANSDRKKEVTVDQNKKKSEKKDNADQDSKDLAAQQRAQAKATAWTGVINGIGTSAAGLFKFIATEQQAEQKESEARQKTHENAAQSWSEWMQLQQDMVKNAQSKIEEITRLHFDGLKTASRG